MVEIAPPVLINLYIHEIVELLTSAMNVHYVTLQLLAVECMKYMCSQEELGAWIYLYNVLDCVYNVLDCVYYV